MAILSYRSAVDMSSLSNAEAHSIIMILILAHTTNQINSTFYNIFSMLMISHVTPQ